MKMVLCWLQCPTFMHTSEKWSFFQFQTRKLSILTQIVTFNNLLAFCSPALLTVLQFPDFVDNKQTRQGACVCGGDRMDKHHNSFFYKRFPLPRIKKANKEYTMSAEKKEPLFASWGSYWPLSGERDAKCGRRLITWKGRGFAWSDGGEDGQQWWGWGTQRLMVGYPYMGRLLQGSEPGGAGGVSERLTIQINMDASATFPSQYHRHKRQVCPH